MKFACPQCLTSYTMDDSTIPESGLHVKCSVCGSEFIMKKKAGPSEQPVTDQKENTGNKADDLFEDFTPPSSESSSLDDLFSDFGSQKAPQESAPEQPSPVTSSKKADAFDDLFDNFGIPESSESSHNQNPEESISVSSFGANNEVESHLHQNNDESVTPSSDSINLASKQIDEIDFLSDLLGNSDSPEPESVPKGNVDLFADVSFSGPSPDESDPEEESVYIKDKKTGRISGPFPLSSIPSLLAGKSIAPDSLVSLDRESWSPLPFSEEDDLTEFTISGNMDSQPGEKDDSHTRVEYTVSTSHGFAPEDMTRMEYTTTTEHASASQKRKLSLFGDQLHQPEIKGEKKKISLVNHTVLPEMSKEEKKERKKTKKSWKPAFTVTGLSVFIILCAAGAAYWWFVIKKNDDTNKLQQVTETIPESSGTLTDVRDALGTDTQSSYIKALGILKRYMSSSDTPPAVTGLDAQIKLNLLLSYLKTIEPLTSLNQRLTKAFEDNPDNPDIIKAIALLNLAEKKYPRAAELMQPYAATNDPEALYILGVAALNSNEMKNAESYLNSAYIQSNGRSNKAAYKMAEMKAESGDSETALAFLNKIISDNPEYLKAYTKKASIFLKEKNDPKAALSFLQNINPTFLSAADDPAKADYYAMLGLLYQTTGKNLTALDQYKKAVDFAPANLNYLTDLAGAYRETGNSSLALETYNKALNLDPKNIEALLGKAETFVHMQGADKALLEIAKIDVSSLTNPQQLLRLGNIYNNLREYDKAIQFYDKAIKVKPSFIEPYMQKMYIYLDFNKIDEIKDIAIKIGQLDQDSYPYYLIRGILFHEEGEWEKAEEAFAKAIEKDNDKDPAVYYFFGKLLMDEKKYPKASEMFLQALSLSPGNLRYRESLAESLLLEKKYEEVTALYRNILIKERKYYRSFLYLAEAFYALRQYDTALKDIEKSISLDARVSRLFYIKAKILYAKGDFHLADIAIQQAIMLDIKSFENYLLYAKILNKKGDYKSAIEKIEEAEQIDPTSQELFIIKGIIYKNLDNFPEALTYFKKVKDPQMLQEAYFEIGECYKQLRKENDAISYLKKAVDVGNTNAYESLAEIYYDKGNLDKALFYYKKTLEVNRHNPSSINRMGYIYKEKKQYGKARMYFKKYMDLPGTDPNERQMIKDEIFYLEQNIPKSKLARIKQMESAAEEESKEDSGGGASEDAKTLYMEGLSMKESDPEEARKRFEEVLSLVDEDNKYYKKAKKALNSL